MIELLKYKNNPRGRVVIILADGTAISGFLTSEFSVEGKANYGSPADMSSQDSMNQMLGKGQMLMNTAASWFGSSGTGGQIQLKSLSQTIASWQGTEKPSFSVSMMIPALKKGDNILNSTVKLLQAIYPTGTDLLRAPNGYAPSRSSAKGVSSIKIGSWFNAQNQIIESVSEVFSMQEVENGSPLYSNVVVGFSPWRSLNADDIAGYFNV